MAVILEHAWSDFVDCTARQRPSLFKRLTPGQRAFVAIQLLAGEIYNGGLKQFFENSSGDVTDEVLLGLRRIGAKLLLSRLRSVLKTFPKQLKLSNRRHRQAWMKGCSWDQMDVLFNDYFFRLERSKRTQLEALRWNYFKQHQQEFILPENEPEPVLAPQQLGSRDYLILARQAKGLRGQKLLWKLIAKAWDDYFLALKAGEKEFDRFVRSLSPGLRALTVLDLLHKTVLNLDGFSHFLANQLRSHLLVDEVKAGYRHLNATPYESIFSRVLDLAGDLSGLNAEVVSKSEAYAQAKASGDAALIEARGKGFMESHTRRQKRLRELEDRLDSLSEELKDLLTNPRTAFELYLETYVAKNPQDFFR